MANLKSLKVRIGSVKSTQKITKAMKMVAASKLRRARERAEAAAPYTVRMRNMVEQLASSLPNLRSAPILMAGRAVEKTVLLVVVSSDRGLCGGLNTAVVRMIKRRIREIKSKGQEVKLFCVGKKAADQLKRSYPESIIGIREGLSRKNPTFRDAEELAKQITHWFESGEIDRCAVVYSAFKSAISQIVTEQTIIPLEQAAGGAEKKSSAPARPVAIYSFEPNVGSILNALLPRNLAVQLYHALLENSASEQGARMSAMDSASRNAGEMIKKLTLVYNRTRQAAITKELIEIISGAEAI
jgi:F-type H+-transporting ATPase subunit gamma